jgi:hypothetical protein
MESPGGGGRAWRWCLAVLLVGGALALTNPDEQDFEAFAGERLVALADQQLCDRAGLSLLTRLLIQNCPELVRSQKGVLGKLALAGTRRFNAGVFSVYSTQLGGESLLPGLRLPRYSTLTLAAAGQLVMLRATSDSDER